jgi:hypothetical protein
MNKGMRFSKRYGFSSMADLGWSNEKVFPNTPLDRRRRINVMAHILAGEWRSFVVSSQTGEPGGDKKFILKINEASGLIEAGSTHDGAAVEGKASPGNAPFHNIKIDKPSGPKKYRGYLLVNGPQLMLVGFVNRDPGGPPPEGLSADETTAFFDQQQEVWIATKP